MSKKFFIFLGAYLLLLGFVFRNLLANINSHLLDWLDTALVNWLILQNIEKFKSFNFSNLFNTNAFYPHPDSLFFADTFIPQAILGLPFSFLTNNPILIYNVVFFITFILNYISAYLFWKQIFKKDLVAFFGGLLMIFSPFFHLQLSHFQMMSFWPLFFTLYFIFKYEESHKRKNIVVAGLFLAIQFLASIYLSIYLFFAIGFYYMYKFIFKDSLTKSHLYNLLILLTIFLFVDGIFIKGYFDMKREYHIQRDIKEYINYSAHLSDYIFTTPINSIVHKSFLLEKWNHFDKNFIGGKAAFPGFLLFFLSLFGLFQLVKSKAEITIKMPLNKQKLYFLTLLLTGFLFSLGPRVNFNGSYAQIPLPYGFLMKFIPFLEAARVPSRWTFFFYLGLIYFALSFISTLQAKKYFKYFISFFLLIFLLEYVPINITTHHEDFINNQYLLLKNTCELKKQALLEIPVTHLSVYPDIGTGVSYISKVELSTLYHKCNLVNGYSGYDLPELFKLQSDIDNLLLTQNTEALIKELKSYQVDIIKINSSYVVAEQKIPIKLFEMQLDHSSLVVRIDQGLYKIK